MKISIIAAVFLSLLITIAGCSDPEESGRQAREKYNTLKEAATPVIEKAKAKVVPVIEKAKSDSESFINGFMNEKESEKNISGDNKVESR